MLLWHGQPDHCWPSPGDLHPLPSSGGLRDPPVLPSLKREEPSGISPWQPGLPAFRYTLCAPTSPAVRHHQETLTYLNQGQSYEIRMVGAARGDPAEGRRMVKSSPISASVLPQSSSSSASFEPQSGPSSAPVQPQFCPGPSPAQPRSGQCPVGPWPWAQPVAGPAQSVLRVVFHDRRLRYSEQQQLEGWRWSRPGDRILDIDIPLSVGILEPQIHPTLLNTVEFLWEPSRRTSVFVQVHCVSTEFTLRKNGGEKGVPFRIQIDTFGAGGKGDPPRAPPLRQLPGQGVQGIGVGGKNQCSQCDQCPPSTGSSSSGLRGGCMAGPGHPRDAGVSGGLGAALTPRHSPRGPTGSRRRTGRRWRSSRRPSGTNSSRPTRAPCWPRWGPALAPPVGRGYPRDPAPIHHPPPSSSVPPVAGRAGSPPQPPGAAVPGPLQAAEPREVSGDPRTPLSPLRGAPSKPGPPAGYARHPPALPRAPRRALSPCASPLETQQWLLRRRFSSCARVFANFTGADLLKLSRRDLVQICGAPDGIRLCHALAGRCPRPRLTLYVAREPGGAERAEDAGTGAGRGLRWAGRGPGGEGGGSGVRGGAQV
ncbi:hypothetical protein DV515_00017913 [Chloebia gouldiae]|uniref:Grh/CP2 DB domain-containing protein n=1 Tax=Chloebia gouldiae TaxID=44316 RepID=A0A3L8Q8Y9_CHLGU|nr:hypothetical protein DV515_00017914 [Chloebia gouldiae]RLV63790.1 hypothetical protein DV515_00017913 [Chloebia gouldiae]